MPMHDYRCTKCGHEFEDLIALGEADPVCPTCGSPTERVFSSIHLGKAERRPTAKADYYRNLGYNEAKGRYKKKEE